MNAKKLPYRIIRAIGISLTLGTGVFIAVFFGMVFYADYKYPQHNSMSGIEAFTIGALTGITVFALSLCISLIVIFATKASDPTTAY